MLINVAATFAPLLFSVGSVLFMARAYAQRISKWFAMWSIAAWCVSQVSIGFALLLFLHAIEKDHENMPATSLFIILLMLALWIIVSVAFLWHSLAVASVASLVNVVVHFVFVGIALTESGKIAMLFALLGTFWAGWAFLFAVSFVLYLRRKSMTHLSNVMMNKMRVHSAYRQQDV